MSSCEARILDAERVFAGSGEVYHTTKKCSSAATIKMAVDDGEAKMGLCKPCLRRFIGRAKTPDNWYGWFDCAYPSGARVMYSAWWRDMKKKDGPSKAAGFGAELCAAAAGIAASRGDPAALAAAYSAFIVTATAASECVRNGCVMSEVLSSAQAKQPVVSEVLSSAPAATHAPAPATPPPEPVAVDEITEKMGAIVLEGVVGASASLSKKEMLTQQIADLDAWFKGGMAGKKAAEIKKKYKEVSDLKAQLKMIQRR